MRGVAVVVMFGLSAGAAQADKVAAEACRATLSATGQEIYDATLAAGPTPATARGIVTKEVEKLIAAGKVSLSEGRADGRAAGECLKKLE